MKTLALIPLLLHLVSASAFDSPQSLQILRGNVEIAEADIRHLLATHNDDPVEVMRLVDPGHAAILDEPRLLEVSGTEPAWAMEGDKLRLRKQGLSFTDLTGHENLFRSTVPLNNHLGACLFVCVGGTRGNFLIGAHPRNFS